MWFILRSGVLGIWLGAMVGFAFIFAPIALSHVGPSPAFAGTIGANLRAITTMGEMLGAIAVAVTVFARFESRRAASAIVACIAAAIVLGIVQVAAIVPKVEQTPALTPAFHAVHQQSTSVYGIALLCVAAAFAIATNANRIPD